MRPVVIIQRFDTTEQTVKAEQKAIREQTIAEKWSSDEEDMNDFGPADSTDSEDLSLKVLKTILLKGASEPPTKRPKTLENSNETKRKRLTGKNACKFCATVFASKAERSKHNCKYLQCDPKNFICRVCSKELNKKTFSNHVHHENTTCEYCGKSFSNPRKMRVHIKRFHAGQNTSLNQEKLTEISLLHEARNYYRKTKKIFECGKYLLRKLSNCFHGRLYTFPNFQIFAESSCVGTSRLRIT